MSLPRWSAEGRLRPHHASRSEITSLLAAVDRDLDDAATPGLSPDRRFAIAYSAALALASVALRASGYRALGAGHHEITMRSLPFTMGPGSAARARYLDSCRIKRNRIDYDGAGFATDSEGDEIVSEVAVFRSEVIRWLETAHPELVP